jgi:hypothetical protein
MVLVDGDFLSAATKSSLAAAILLAEDVAGISTLSGKNSMVLVVLTPQVAVMQAL